MSEFDDEEEKSTGFEDEVRSVSSCEASEISEEESWETLKGHENYEISTKYPYQIVKKSNGRIISEFTSHDYPSVTLDGKTYNKHRLIAEQFIPNPNPEEFKVIDHINGDRGDNHIQNLRWTTQKQNCRNKHTSYRIAYEFVDVLPEGAIAVDKYSRWCFENLYYCDNSFYYDTGLNFRILRIHDDFGRYIVNTLDANGNFRAISLAKFKRERRLI
jgi:hypothetical protein